MARPSGVPVWDWYLHQAWWVIARWSKVERARGRTVIANHYVNRHLRDAVQAAGIATEDQPAAWQYLVRALDETKSRAQDRSGPRS